MTLGFAAGCEDADVVFVLEANFWRDGGRIMGGGVVFFYSAAGVGSDFIYSDAATGSIWVVDSAVASST